MSTHLSQISERMLFSDELSSIPDTGTRHGYDVMSEPSTEGLQLGKHAPFASVLSSAERKHYNRALQELCRIVKLGSRKLDAVEQASYGSKPGHSRETRRHRRNYDKDAPDDVASLSDPDVTLHLPTSQRSNGRHDDIHDEEGDIDDDVDIDDDEYDRGYIKSKHHRGRTAKRRDNTLVDEDAGLNGSATSDQSHALQTVYAELATISKKLQRQSVALQERELAIQEREMVIKRREEVLLSDDTSIRIAQKEFNRKWHKLQEEHDKQVKELEHIIKDRGKEIKRQRESFDTLKQANEGLRNQLDNVQEQNKKMESQAVSLQHRLANLQRHQELTSRQRDHQNVSTKARLESVKKFGQQHQVSTSSEPSHKTAPTVRHTKHSSSLYDTLGILLEWVSDVHLRHYSSDPSKPLESLPSPALTCDRCIRVLPSLVEVLGQLPSQAAKLHLPCLQFIYWALLHLDSSDNQHVSLSSTYRRLGEELYRPTVVRFASDQGKSSPEVQSTEKPKSAIFFKSANLHVRFLSSLIILKTISQIDYLANVFDVIRCDLKDERSKELYLRYQATPVILAYMKACNKGVMASAVDVFLQMSMESIFMQQFLFSCSTEPWLRSCAALLSTPNLDVKIWEKLSIILQKLSKLKSNKHLFDTTGVSAVIQEMARTGACQENAFLALNLRSILFNLNLVKMNPTVR